MDFPIFETVTQISTHCQYRRMINFHLWKINIKPLFMDIQEQIKEYMSSLPLAKGSEMEALHHIIISEIMPKKSRLWFLDGKDDKGKIVSNPNIGYGLHIIKYADGKSKEFYQIGISANTTGISVYVMGIENKKYLPETYGKTIGKASVSGYCIKFKSIKDIHIEILKEVIRYGLNNSVS